MKFDGWKESYGIQEVDDVLNVAVNAIHDFLTKDSDLLKPIANECHNQAWIAIARWKERKRKQAEKEKQG